MVDSVYILDSVKLNGIRIQLASVTIDRTSLVAAQYSKFPELDRRLELLENPNRLGDWAGFQAVPTSRTRTNGQRQKEKEWRVFFDCITARVPAEGYSHVHGQVGFLKVNIDFTDKSSTQRLWLADFVVGIDNVQLNPDNTRATLMVTLNCRAVDARNEH